MFLNLLGSGIRINFKFLLEASNLRDSIPSLRKILDYNIFDIVLYKKQQKYYVEYCEKAIHPAMPDIFICFREVEYESEEMALKFIKYLLNTYSIVDIDENLYKTQEIYKNWLGINTDKEFLKIDFKNLVKNKEKKEC